MNIGLISCGSEKEICNDRIIPYLDLVQVLLAEKAKV